MREREAYGTQTLDAVLGRAKVSPDDVALATRLARGTLASLGTLDEALDRFIARPGDVEPQVRDALRVSAYELLFARTPARAAVHQGVEAVRRVRPQAAGLANAVLRRLAEAAGDFPWGDPATDLEAFARLTAHPLWLVERLVSERGHPVARAMLEADAEPAPVYLWHNPFRGTAEEALARLEADGAEPVSCPLPGCLQALAGRAAVRGEAVASGIVLVTDAAAQFAARALDPRPGTLVVDLASGRGTKTVQLQALAVAAGGPAHLVSLDVHGFKADILRDRMVALGVPGVTALAGDATDLVAVPGMPPLASADAVLLDAPCSGLGTLRRHPEKRWRVSAGDVVQLAALQVRLLAEASRLVGSGGVVVYSTCSVLREENEDVVRGFLDGERGAGFRVASTADAVPAKWAGSITAEGYFQSLPAIGGPDGHFVAVLTRA